MSDTTTTFTFEEDGSVHAILGNQVIASGSADDFEAVEADANAYIEGKEAEEKTARRKKATHVITPNGLKGSIIGRTPDVWGDTEVTVRFENNHISRFVVKAGDDFEWVEEEEGSDKDTPTKTLESRINADYGTDRESLVTRVAELKDVSKEARNIVTYSGAPETTKAKIASLHTAAEAEIEEINQVLAAMEDSQQFEEFAPFRTEVVAQANIGHDSGSWLDVVASETIEAAESVDLDRVMNEGPAIFASTLDNSIIADSGAVAEMARGHVASTVPLLDESEAEGFKTSFVARVEVARRHELAARKAEEKHKVVASQEKLDDLPDEALFI